MLTQPIVNLVFQYRFTKARAAALAVDYAGAANALVLTAVNKCQQRLSRLGRRQAMQVKLTGDAELSASQLVQLAFLQSGSRIPDLLAGFDVGKKIFV